jgi:hypothetical protein
MLNTYEINLEAVVCASCDEVFWDWADSTDTICGWCVDYEPLYFDDWED